MLYDNPQMSALPIGPVEIQHEYEEWQGTASLPRILALRSVGVSVTQIAKRFKVSREMIYRVLNSPPVPSTDEAGSTNPEAGPHQQMQADDTQASPTESNGGK